jgi:hypothetical protein
MMDKEFEMSSAERLMAVWNREIPDRTPWSPMLGDSYLRSHPRYWDSLSAEQRSKLQSTYKYPSIVPLPTALDFLEPVIEQMTLDVGGDFITRVQTVEQVDGRVEIEVLPGDGGETTFIFHTPWGELREIVSGSGSAETVYRVRFSVSDRDEYQIMSRVVENRSYRTRYERYADKLRSLGNRGVSALWGPDQPLVSIFRVRDPVELIYDFNEEPDRMQALLDLLHQCTLEAYRQVAQGPGILVETGMAFMTIRLISPRMFEAYVLPYLAEYASILHDAGKKLICHMCGHIRPLLPMLREAGVDGIDSLSPPPIGDTELETCWQLLGEDAILQGGIDVNVLLNGSTRQVVSHVGDVLRRTQGRPLVLRSADEVPSGTPIENLKVAAEEVKIFQDQQG